VKEFPSGLTNVLNDYIREIRWNYSLTDDKAHEIDDCITAAYAYGVVCGLGMASAVTGTSVFKAMPMDDKGSPIINTFLNTAAALEDDLVEFYKEDLGL
jgi:hypothetical protein